MVSLVRAHWGLGSRLLTDVFLAEADADERDAFARFQRESASGGVAARSLEAVYGMDVADSSSRVKAATLVMHRREDTAVPFDLGRDLASRIPAAVFAPLNGREHFPWRGDSAAVVRATLRFLGVPTSKIDLRRFSDLSGPSNPGPGSPAHTLSRRRAGPAAGSGRTERCHRHGDGTEHAHGAPSHRQHPHQDSGCPRVRRRRRRRHASVCPDPVR